jgi:hypothetical protein
VSEHYYSACESKFANGNGTIQLIKAIYVLRSKGVKIKALVISFDEKLELHFRQKYSECYILLPQVSHDRIWDYYKKCHFGFIGYGDVFGHKSIPNRFIEYTCALIPVIYHNTSVQMNYWNQSMDVGVAINVEDVNSIVDILELFCEDQDFWFKKVDNCRKHRNEFSLEKGSRNLQLMYESL